MDPFEDCLSKGRLKRIRPDAELIAAELAVARGEFERARASYVKGHWDESITQSYFAMYRCARAVIHSLGYRDTNVYGLCVALQSLLVDNDPTVDRDTVRQIRAAKDLKDGVYGGYRGAPREARNLLQWTLRLAKAVFGRLSLPGFDPSDINTTMPRRPDPKRARRRPRPRRPFGGEDGVSFRR